MVSPATIYAIAASGIFVTFALPVALCIWWRRRFIKAQQAYANSIPETTPTSVPGVHIDPFDYVTPVLGNKPGGGNVEFPSVRHLQSLSLEKISVLTCRGYDSPTRTLPPHQAPKEIRRAPARYPRSARSRRNPIPSLPLRTRRCKRLRYLRLHSTPSRY